MIQEMTVRMYEACHIQACLCYNYPSAHCFFAYTETIYSVSAVRKARVYCRPIKQGQINVCSFSVFITRDWAALTDAERSQCTDDGEHDLRWRTCNAQQPDQWLDSTVISNTHLTVKILMTKSHHAHTTYVIHNNTRLRTSVPGQPVRLSRTKMPNHSRFGCSKRERIEVLAVTSWSHVQVICT